MNDWRESWENCLGEDWKTREYDEIIDSFWGVVYNLMEGDLFTEDEEEKIVNFALTLPPYTLTIPRIESFIDLYFDFGYEKAMGKYVNLCKEMHKETNIIKTLEELEKLEKEEIKIKKHRR
jgi:hypothetical protein